MTDVQRGPQVRQVAWDHPDAVRLRAAMTAEMGRRYADRAVELPLGMAVDPGDRQPEAVAAYQRAGYTPIPVFPPYAELPFSLCFEKRLPVSTRTSGAAASPPGYLPSPPGVRTG
ncbi:MAG: hypothetical protein ABSB76_03485 [Streptosporangiaceae bacterium]